MENTEEKVENQISETVETEKKDNNIEGEEISTKEIVAKTDKNRVVLNQATDKYLEENKDKIEKIDWENIKWEDEEKTIPLVTKDDLEVYSAITSSFVGDMELDSWVEMSKNEIKEYNELLKNYDSLSEDDKKYCDSVKNTAQSSRELLALLQTQSKDLKKDFEENKIAENAIKAAVIKTLHDFIIGRYPLSVEKKQKMTEHYENQISKFMYVLPIFRQSVDRDINRVRDEQDKDLYRLSAYSINSDAQDYTIAISIYTKMLGDQDNIDLSSIIAKDFDFMNFFVITVLYSVYKYGDKDFVTKNIKNIDEKTLESLNSTMNPSNFLEPKYKALSDLVFYVLDKFKNKETLKKIIDIIDSALKSDKTFKFYFNTIKDYKDIFTEIIKNIPTIVDNKIGAWNKYYRTIRKMNLYFTFNDLFNLGESKGYDSDEFKAGSFNVLIKYIKYIYEHYFTRFIVDFEEFLKYDVNSKESRDIFFKTCINETNVLHSFGFKTGFNIENEDYKAPKIYELAKEKMGKLYDTTIVDESDDIILKEVDLKVVKAEYVNIVYDSLSEFNTELDNL